MREILFRAWDKQRREYLSGGEVFIAIQPGKLPKNILYLDILKDPDTHKDRFELEQYTGLTDKNGVKIFEGDIIRVRFESDHYPECGFEVWFERFAVIFSDEHHAWFTRIDDGEIGEWLYEYDEDCEVVGNVHDEKGAKHEIPQETRCD